MVALLAGFGDRALSFKRVPLMQMAYLLQRWPYQETSLIAEFWTADAGKIRAIVQGGRNVKRKGGSLLQLFMPLSVLCTGRQGLKQLRSFEPGSTRNRMGAEAVLCGFYLNELLIRLLESEVAYPDLFLRYAALMETLAQPTQAGFTHDGVLRSFEMRLLQQIGYGLPAREMIDPKVSYTFSPSQGFTPYVSESLGRGHILLLGEHLAAMIEGNFSDPRVNRLAKKVAQLQFQERLQGRPLRSRELFEHFLALSQHHPRSAAKRLACQPGPAYTDLSE